MKNITVKICRLENYHDGIVSAADVAFKVIQAGRTLIEDNLSGKITGPYKRSYQSVASDEPLQVEHDRADLPWLSITAFIES